MSIGGIYPKSKTSISVREMTMLLGLSKVEGYWLVKKNLFQIVTIAGRMRIILDSFNEWYAGQFHYKKVKGEPPGSKWTDKTMSFRETVDLLGISDATLYDLIKKELFCTYKIDNTRRIDKADFNRWYYSQNIYLTVDDRKAYEEANKDTFTVAEIKHMLHISRNTVYYIIKAGKIPTFNSGRIKRIKKSDFAKWYHSQNHYKIMGGDICGINHKKEK